MKPRHIPGRFLRGPFVLEDFNTAARLPGQALSVWLLVHHQHELRREDEITLPRDLLTDAGVSREAKVHALRLLEGANLIAVTWERGKSPRIRLID